MITNILHLATIAFNITTNTEVEDFQFRPQEKLEITRIVESLTYEFPLENRLIKGTNRVVQMEKRVTLVPIFTNSDNNISWGEGKGERRTAAISPPPIPTLVITNKDNIKFFNQDWHDFPVFTNYFAPITNITITQTNFPMHIKVKRGARVVVEPLEEEAELPQSKYILPGAP